MAWDEWEQLKAAAVERQSTQMQLNHAAPDPGSMAGSSGGAKILKSDKPSWTKAGEGVGSLRDDITKALTNLETSNTGLSEDSGCLTSKAQSDVYNSWDRYVRKVSGRCGDLAGMMGKVGSDLLKTDESVDAEIARLKTQYEDTPAVGGQTKGR